VAVNIPAASGLDYNGGGVRHVGKADVLDSESISLSTRALAFRDAKLASSINAIIAHLNARPASQPALVFPPTRLMPGESVRLGNLAIPAGTSATLAALAMATDPVVTGVNLAVYHSTGYGGNTGELVKAVTVSGVSAAPTTAYTGGEFVFVASNTAPAAVTVTASAMVKLSDV